MKVGKHHTEGGVKRGKDVDNGIRFEAKLKARAKRRKPDPTRPPALLARRLSEVLEV